MQPGMGIFFPLVPMEKQKPLSNKEFFSEPSHQPPFFSDLALIISIFHATTPSFSPSPSKQSPEATIFPRKMAATTPPISERNNDDQKK